MKRAPCVLGEKSHWCEHLNQRCIIEFCPIHRPTPACVSSSVLPILLYKADMSESPASSPQGCWGAAAACCRLSDRRCVWRPQPLPQSLLLSAPLPGTSFLILPVGPPSSPPHSAVHLFRVQRSRLGLGSDDWKVKGLKKMTKCPKNTKPYALCDFTQSSSTATQNKQSFCLWKLVFHFQEILMEKMKPIVPFLFQVTSPKHNLLFCWVCWQWKMPSTDLVCALWRHKTFCWL